MKVCTGNINITSVPYVLKMHSSNSQIHWGEEEAQNYLPVDAAQTPYCAIVIGLAAVSPSCAVVLEESLASSGAAWSFFLYWPHYNALWFILLCFIIYYSCIVLTTLCVVLFFLIIIFLHNILLLFFFPFILLLSTTTTLYIYCFIIALMNQWILTWLHLGSVCRGKHAHFANTDIQTTEVSGTLMQACLQPCDHI